jgi:hypothetical protein
MAISAFYVFLRLSISLPVEFRVKHGIWSGNYKRNQGKGYHYLEITFSCTSMAYQNWTIRNAGLLPVPGWQPGWQDTDRRTAQLLRRKE